MKKILIFSTAYYPFVGGAEVAVKEISDRIPNIHFDMVTARMDKKLPKVEKVGNVNVYRLGVGFPVFDKYFLTFFGSSFGAKLNKKNNYNAIWAIMASYGGFAAMFFKKKNPRIPFLLTLQEGDDPAYIQKRVGLMKKSFKQIFLSANYIQCISNYLSGWAKENGATCPIQAVPNGVDFDKFSIFDFRFSKEKYKEKLNIKNDEKVIITTSRLVKKNGIDDLIKSIPLLKEKNCKLLILGIGPQEKELKKLVKDLNIENKVLFLGYIPHSELPSYLWISDVFCRPSLSEGLGNSFLEAMAAGVPVVATSVGGIPDFLKDNQTGLFCTANDPKSIGEKISEILNNPELKNNLIANATKLIKENYDWNHIAARMERIFNNLL